MKKIFFAIAIPLLAGCVKDPSNSVSNDFFTIMVKPSLSGITTGIEQARFDADNSTRYYFELKERDGLSIDDNKQVTVTVTDGSLSTAASATGTNTINVLTLGGKANFFYMAGKTPKKGVVLTLTIQGQTQSFTFDILASEPDKILLTPKLQTQNINENISILAYLEKNNEPKFVSQGLQVKFKWEPVSATDLVQVFNVPDFGISSYSDVNMYTSVQRSLTTNRVEGMVRIWAEYTRADQKLIRSDTALFKFAK